MPTATIKVEKENVIAEATHVVRLDINHLYNLDVKTQSGFKVRLSGKMRGKAILDFQTARHQNGIAVKLNGKYPYDDGIESSWERKKRLLKKGINYARTHGVKKAIRRVKLGLKPGSIDYAEWISRHEKPDLKEQRKEVQGFAYRPLISILMPVYNDEIKWLEKCINSVLDQTYDHWELCISDDASTLIQLSESVWNPIKQKMIESKSFSDKKMDTSVWQLILHWKWQKESL